MAGRSVPLSGSLRDINFDEYTRQGSSKLYLKSNLCGTFLLLKADRTSPRMIEHWGEDKRKKTSKMSERHRANELLEVQMTEIAHNDSEAFGSGACTPLEKYVHMIAVSVFKFHDSINLIRFTQQLWSLKLIFLGTHVA